MRQWLLRWSQSFHSDKKAACYSLGGYLKSEERDTLLECEIECCNSSRCNTKNSSLTQDAVTVFTPEGIILNIFRLYILQNQSYASLPWTFVMFGPNHLVSISRQLENGLAIVTCSLVASHADVRRASSPVPCPRTSAGGRVTKP